MKASAAFVDFVPVVPAFVTGRRFGTGGAARLVVERLCRVTKQGMAQ
jgi:hypothetical protein